MNNHVALIVALFTVTSFGKASSTCVATEPDALIQLQKNQSVQAKKQRVEAKKQLSAITMVENWDIVLRNSPFSARPGSKFSQEAFNWRAKDKLEWQLSVSRLKSSQRLAALKAIAGFSILEHALQQKVKLKVLRAYVSELSMAEHVRLAKAEAKRPKTFYDTRVRGAFAWIVHQQSLSPKSRTAMWNKALAVPSTQLKKEIRNRFRRHFPQKNTKKQ